MATLIPEPTRNLRITDREWLETFYPQMQREWWLEFRFLEDRADGVKGPPVAVRFLRDFDAISNHLGKHRDSAAYHASQLRESGFGPWPAGLFWGLHPRRTRRGTAQDVAALVALASDLDCKDWPEIPEADRPKAVWERLHTAAPPPTAVTWTGHGLHAYWLLQEPLADKQRGEELGRAMARCLRGDHVWDCARLLRWPNSVNYKGVLHGQCRAVRLVWWHPELRYEFDVLAGHFQANGSTEDSGLDQVAGDRLVWYRFYRCLDTDSALRALWEGMPTGLDINDRSTLDMALAHALVRHQFASEAFAVIAREAPWNAGKTLAPLYLKRTWNKATDRRSGARKRVCAKDKVVTAVSERLDAARPSAPAPDGPELLLTSLPESAWTNWARLYREAVGASTEAADELHYVALLTVLGAALGRAVTVFSGRPIHANVYSMLIGPTGDRKSTAAELALGLLRRVAPEVLLLNGVGSQEGLMERMAGAGASSGHSRTLLFVDEMAALLKKGRRESSGSLMEFITELFHGPESKTHFTRTNAIHLDRPTLSILAASTPAWLEAALEEEDILGGFTNRFVYVLAPSKPDNPLPAPPDATKLRELHDWMRRVILAPPRAMTWQPDAKEMWCDLYVKWRRFLTDQNERTGALLRRIDLYVQKFACINAAMAETTLISSTHLAPAIDLGRFLAGCAHQVLGELGVPRDYRLERLIETKLQAAGGSIRRKLLRQTLGGRITGEKLDRILRAMERNGLIYQVDEQTAHGSSRLVKLVPQD